MIKHWWHRKSSNLQTIYIIAVINLLIVVATALFAPQAVSVVNQIGLASWLLFGLIMLVSEWRDGWFHRILNAGYVVFGLWMLLR